MLKYFRYKTNKPGASIFTWQSTEIYIRPVFRNDTVHYRRCSSPKNIDIHRYQSRHIHRFIHVTKVSTHKSITTMSHRVILITGASAGIGRSCAITLSKAFPSEEHSQPLVLFLVGRREEELKKTGEACKEGTIIEIQTGDMGKEEDVERIFSVVKEKYGRLDLLFNVSSSTMSAVVWNGY
jgi:hypothetical protein